MATSIGQCAPVFLPGEPPSLAGHSLQGCKDSDTTEVPWAHRHKSFFACGCSAPVSVEREGGAAAWLEGTLAAPSVQGHGLPLLQELWPYHSLLLNLL